MRQGKAESILDYTFREEILTVALKKDTAIDLDEKIQRILADENVEPHGTRNFWNQDHHLGQTQLAQVKKAITQTTVAKKREEVRDDLREAGDRARDRPAGYAEAPNFHLHGNSDDDQADTISESESNCSEQWYELDRQEQEALISLRDTRKKLQHATKLRVFYPKGGGRAGSTGKSIDELKKVTPCNRCGAIGHWREDCTQPARSRKKRSPSGKGKSRRFRREKPDGKGRGGSSNYPIAEVYNDGSKTQTSHMKVPLGYAVLDCGATKSLCGAKSVTLMAHVHERVNELETSATLRQSMRVTISEESENQIVSSIMKLRVLGSIDGKEVSFAPSVTPGDIPPLVVSR